MCLDVIAGLINVYLKTILGSDLVSLCKLHLLNKNTRSSFSDAYKLPIGHVKVLLLSFYSGSNGVPFNCLFNMAATTHKILSEVQCVY
jgi:hypothetical protein